MPEPNDPPPSNTILLISEMGKTLSRFLIWPLTKLYGYLPRLGFAGSDYIYLFYIGLIYGSIVYFIKNKISKKI